MYKPYPKYKKSGVAWLGDVPEGWEISKLKYLVEVKDGTHDTPSYVEQSNESYPLVTSKDLQKGYLDFEKCKYISYKDYISINRRSNVEMNDILMPMIGTVGGAVIIDINKKFSIKNVALFKINSLKTISPYIKYFLDSTFVTKQFKLESRGGVQDFVSLNILNNIVSFSLPLKEQTQISNYLTQKTKKIDTLIKKQQTLIELLKEKRQALISHVVTKGLDEENSSWNKYRLDWVTTIVRGNTGFKKDELLKTGKYVALQYGKTYKVDEINDTFNFYVNDEFYKFAQVVNYGDVILISTSETVEDLGHSCFYSRDDLGLIGGEQILLKPNSRLIFGKYLYYKSKVFSNELKKYSTGLKVFRFNIDDLKCIFISIPNIEDQQKIANHLDQKTKQIDTLIEKSTKAIELLKERRVALVSAVVTGKVDVRGGSCRFDSK